MRPIVQGISGEEEAMGMADGVLGIAWSLTTLVGCRNVKGVHFIVTL